MSQAIIYLNQNDMDNIPKQAINIAINDKELNKETLLTSVAKACGFPSYFGHNWDALWDSLTDSEIQYLKLDLTEVKTINTEDFNMFKSIIKDAFKDFGQPQLWVVL